MATSELRICAKCGEEKPVTKFVRHEQYGYGKTCQACASRGTDAIILGYIEPLYVPIDYKAHRNHIVSKLLQARRVSGDD